ncbi:Uncharacterised protein [Achromobacter xylosoxidans]|nr:Uncharacterised protein [Achromobacter xylosoxidans]
MVRDVGRLDMHAGIGAGRVEQVAHRGAGVAQRQRHLRQVAHADAAARGQRMAPAHDGVDRRAALQFGLEALVGRHRVAQRQLRQPFQHQPVDLLRPLHQQVEARLGADTLEVGHALRQEAMGKAFSAGQPDGHVAQRAALADAGGDALGLQRGGVGVCRQLAAGLAQCHAARLALEQRNAQLVLQLGDLAAHGRGRHVLRGGGAGDGAAARHLQEIPQAQRNHGKLPQAIA